MTASTTTAATTAGPSVSEAPASARAPTPAYVPAQAAGAARPARPPVNTNTHCRPTNTNATYTPALVLDSNNVPYATPAHSTWNGCVADRGNSTAPNTGNYDTNVTAPSTSNAATLFPAEQYSMCPSGDHAAQLQLDGDENVWSTACRPTATPTRPSASQLGWMSLVGGGPFTAPPAKDPNYTYQQVIILLTDGLNTQDRWYTSQTLDRRAPAADLQQRQGGGHHALHDPGQYRRRSDLDAAAELRADARIRDKFFLLTSANADRHDLQSDRHRALEPAGAK